MLQGVGSVKRASTADFVNVDGCLTEVEDSREGRGRTVEEALPEGAARHRSTRQGRAPGAMLGHHCPWGLPTCPWRLATHIAIPVSLR